MDQSSICSHRYIRPKVLSFGARDDESFLNLDDVAVYATNGPPIITAQPTNQTVVVSSTATFSVTAGATQPLNYQWSLNGTNLLGATNMTLTLTNVQLNQAGNYAVLVTNAYGSAVSSNALLTVISPGTPVCDEATLQAEVAAGGTITFGCDGVITLTKTLKITKPTTLDGTGHTVTLSGGSAVGVFTVNGANTLSLFNLTIANGFAVGTDAVPGTTGGSGQGGGVLLNGGTLIASNCQFLANVAQGGGCCHPLPTLAMAVMDWVGPSMSTMEIFRFLIVLLSAIKPGAPSEWTMFPADIRGYQREVPGMVLVGRFIVPPAWCKW